MNKDNILAVADAIENHTIPDLGFNMSNWFSPTSQDRRDNSGHGCGTVACVAGWSAVLATGRQPDNNRWYYGKDHAEKVAKEYLGLSWPDSSRLFEPEEDVYEWRDIPPARAVAVLRHLAATGEIDWTVPFEAKPEPVTP